MSARASRMRRCRNPLPLPFTGISDEHSLATITQAHYSQKLLFLPTRRGLLDGSLIALNTPPNFAPNVSEAQRESEVCIEAIWVASRTHDASQGSLPERQRGESSLSQDVSDL